MQRKKTKKILKGEIWSAIYHTKVLTDINDFVTDEITENIWRMLERGGWLDELTEKGEK